MGLLAAVATSAKGTGSSEPHSKVQFPPAAIEKDETKTSNMRGLRHTHQSCATLLASMLIGSASQEGGCGTGVFARHIEYSGYRPLIYHLTVGLSTPSAANNLRHLSYGLPVLCLAPSPVLYHPIYRSLASKTYTADYYAANIQ